MSWALELLSALLVVLPGASAAHATGASGADRALLAPHEREGASSLRADAAHNATPLSKAKPRHDPAAKLKEMAGLALKLSKDERVQASAKRVLAGAASVEGHGGGGRGRGSRRGWRSVWARTRSPGPHIVLERVAPIRRPTLALKYHSRESEGQEGAAPLPPCIPQSEIS